MKQDWLKLRLSPKQVGAGGMIMNACFRLFVAAGFPEDAAMFARNEPGVGIDLFFSPRMAGIVHYVLVPYDTVAVEAPTRDERTVVLIADENAFALLKEKSRR
jgi:hypothetical protein